MATQAVATAHLGQLTTGCILHHRAVIGKRKSQVGTGYFGNAADTRAVSDEGDSQAKSRTHMGKLRGFPAHRLSVGPLHGADKALPERKKGSTHG